MLEIIRNASVEVSVDYVEKASAFGLTIIVDNRFTHEFPVTSKESKLCMNTDLAMIRSLFNGGTFAFFDGNMVDYRNSYYRGFIHDEIGVSELSERIGIKRYNEAKVSGDKFIGGINDGQPGNHASVFNRYRGRGTNGIFLGGEFESFDLCVDGLGEGGHFENRLIYRWSPFSNKITTSLEVMRLVCTNGLVANSPLVTYAVPLINDWQRNLSIVATQLKPKINNLLNDRFLEMRSDRATVRQIVDAHKLLGARSEIITLSHDEKVMLEQMKTQIDPNINLGRYYDQSLFDDALASNGYGGHLTQFDVYNMLTEASSHYGESDTNDNLIQRYLNSVVFDSSKRQHIQVEMPESADSDHRRAFFGKN